MTTSIAPSHEPDLARTRLVTDHFLAFLTASLAVLGRWGVERLINPDSFDAVVAGPEQFERTVAAMLWELRVWLVFVGAAALSFLPLYPPLQAANRLTRASLLLLAYLAIAALWAPPNDYVLPKLLDVFLLAGVIGIANFGARSGRFSQLLANYLLALLLPLAGLSLVPVISGKLAFLSGSLEGDSTRLSVLAGGANTLGRLFGTLLLLSVFMVLNSNRTVVRLAFGFASLVSIALLVAAGSRGAALGVLVGLPFLLLTQRRNPALLLFTMASCVSLAVVTSAMPFDNNLIVIAQDRWVNQTLRDLYDSGRQMLLDAGVRIWLQYPLFGSGLDSFLIEGQTGERYVHNFLLEVLQESGLVGFCLLIHVIFVTLTSAHPLRSKHSSLWMSMLCLWFVYSLFSGELYDSRNVFLFALLAVSAPVAPAAGG